MVTADTVTEELRSDILGGFFAPGERLIELQLTEKYECGRAAVREALVQLEAEGLVERQANRGAVVRRVSIPEAIEITEARAALERLLAERAALKATEEDKEQLLAIVAEMRDSVSEDNAGVYSDLNRRLHGLIRTIGQHSVATELVENLRNRAVQNQYRLAMMPGRREVSFAQHEAIVDAIVAGDESAAGRAMTTHLRSVVDVLDKWNDVL